MGRGGGGGGGGRSFGGGGGRSFGGRSASSGRGGGSFGGSSGRGGGSFGGSSNRGGFGRTPSSGGGFYAPRIFVNAPRTTYHTPPVYGSGGPAPLPPYNGGGGNQNRGNSWTIWVVVVFAVIFFALVMFGNSNSSDITTSTIERKPLPASAVQETPYFTDEVDWIGSSTKLERGLKHFYEKTGVQPYLYITDNIDGVTSPNDQQAEAFLNRFYDENFTDKAHIIVLFHEYTPSQYSMWYLCGEQAKIVMDNEACDILLDYLESYYYDSSLDEDEFFANAFADAADRIMTVTKSPFPIIFILVLAGVLMAFAYGWWNKAKQQKILEAEKAAEILNTPLETFGDTEAENLAKKYEEQTTSKND